MSKKKNNLKLYHYRFPAPLDRTLNSVYLALFRSKHREGLNWFRTVIDFLAIVAQLLCLGIAPHFMKARYIIFGLLGISTVVLARLTTPWDNRKPPTLPLPAAYQLAVAKLGSATNQFHCIEAKLSNGFDGPGWYFSFYTTNSSTIPRFFCVEFNGTVIEEDLSKLQ